MPDGIFFDAGRTDDDLVVEIVDQMLNPGNTTGSLQVAFLLIPAKVIPTMIIWFYHPENTGKELDEILV